MGESANRLRATVERHELKRRRASRPLGHCCLGCPLLLDEHCSRALGGGAQRRNGLLRGLLGLLSLRRERRERADVTIGIVRGNEPGEREKGGLRRMQRVRATSDRCG